MTNKTLAEHQIRIKNLMDGLPVLGIFAEAGTGKTMIALSWICDHLMAGDIEEALVICPVALIPSWKLAIEQMVDFGYTLPEIDAVKQSVKITSYQRTWASDGVKRGYKQYKLRDDIRKHWDVVFVDESHRLGDPKSVQTKQILKLAPMCDRRYIMTGTPDSSNYVKLYGQIKFLDPTIWKSYHEFDMRYVIAHNYFKKPIKFNVPALESLKQTYGTVARLRDCFDMPSENEVDVPIELTEKGVYHDFIHNRVDGYGFDVNVAGIGSQKALQVCSGFYLDADHVQHCLTTQKLSALVDIIDGSDDKIAVYCSYTTSLDMIEDRLKKEKLSYYRFDGSTKEPLWENFQTDDTKVMLVQYQKGCEGLNLYAACRMVFYEPTRSAYQLEQSKARIMRKGQVKHCVYYHMFCEGTIEEDAMRSVRKGVDVSREMLDNWAMLERKRA